MTVQRATAVLGNLMLKRIQADEQSTWLAHHLVDIARGLSGLEARPPARLTGQWTRTHPYTMSAMPSVDRETTVPFGDL
jgi:hypothetical protein